MVAVRRGDVVLVNLDPTVGVEIKKTRPAIVLSNAAINQHSQLAVVVPLTKNVARLSPSHALIPKGAARLTFASKVVTEQSKPSTSSASPDGWEACLRPCSHRLSAPSKILWSCHSFLTFGCCLVPVTLFI